MDFSPGSTASGYRKFAGFDCAEGARCACSFYAFSKSFDLASAVLPVLQPYPRQAQA
jgi:hypothetical protein